MAKVEEAIVAATLSFALGLVKEEWKEYHALKRGAKDELRKLKSAVAVLEEFLQQEQIRGFSKVSQNERLELICQVEDVLEIWLAKKEFTKRKFRFKKLKWLKLDRVVNHSSVYMDKEIKLLREQIQPAADMIQQRNWETEHTPGTSSRIPVLPANKEAPPPWNFDKNSVRFQEEDDIINKLLDQKGGLDVITITGMPGIGKTTFGRKTFEHEKVVSEFKFRFWIDVTDSFSRLEALHSILKKIAGEGEATFPEDEDCLVESLHKSLENKSFLLVLDDVGRLEDWDRIKEFLPKDKGKVLLITGDKDVAAGANIHRMPLHLGGLSQEESSSLLKLQVFDQLQDCHEELEEVLKVVAQSCGGVPLVILVIGGVLKRIFAETLSIVVIKRGWSEISTRVNEVLQEEGFHKLSDSLDKIYRRLSQHAKICFLYMGLFPEDRDIPVTTLMQLWIAEGFVKWNEEDRESLEQKATKVLNMLINKNLLIVKKHSLEQVKTCQLQNMVRVFCRCRAIEEKLFRVTLRSMGGVDPPFSKVPEFRRLCFESDLSDFLSNFPEDSSAKRVRSLHCFYEESLEMQHVDFPKACKYLQILNCSSTTFPRFPKLEKLILLKHITLSVEHLRVLPEDVSCLINLQTLVVHTKQRSITIKSNIGNLIRLRYLKTKAAIFLDDKRWSVKACHNLHTISRLSPHSCNEVLSRRAPNLRALGVRGKLTEIADTMFLKNFKGLDKLKLINDVDDDSAHPIPPLLARLNHTFPPWLKSLTLAKATNMEWRFGMHLLAAMENLQILKLKDNAFNGSSWQVAGKYPCLELLLIDTSQLSVWTTSSEDNFPALRSLVIKNCDKLLRIPTSLGEHLETLEIDIVPRSVAESAKIIEDMKTKGNQNHIKEIPFKLTVGPRCDLPDPVMGSSAAPVQAQ